MCDGKNLKVKSVKFTKSEKEEKGRKPWMVPALGVRGIEQSSGIISGIMLERL